MRLHRFIGKFDLDSDDIAIDDRELINQLKRVLRLKKGDSVILSDGHGKEVAADIVSLTASSAHLQAKERWTNTSEPRNFIHLYCAVLKRENFELVVQKTTEVGAYAIIPILTKRTVKLGLNMARLNKIATEAAEQCGRGRVPIVYPSVEFETAIQQAAEHCQANYMFDGTGTRIDPSVISSVQSVGIFIGPEGGWDDGERMAARTHGIQLLNLGPRTLRAETAAIVATYLSLQN